MLAEHVPPPPVEEAVQDVGGDDVRQRERLRLEAALQREGLGGQHGAHGGRRFEAGCGRAGTRARTPAEETTWGQTVGNNPRY